jgi:hypothetical protein
MAKYSFPASLADLPLIPIVLGVVGHRCIPVDEESLQKLKSAVRKIFEEFDEAYPNSPKVLLSSLAPGADQLAAEVALERSLWSVRAPLPFEPDVYLGSTSFHAKNDQKIVVPLSAAQETFKTLLHHSRTEWFVVPVPDGMDRPLIDWLRVAEGPPSESADDRAVRWACYANAGGYIVRHSHTLLALWDESIATAQPSGSAEIVRFQLGGVPPTYYPEAESEPLGFDGDRGPVIVIHTPSAAGTDDPAVGRRTIRVPSRKDEEYYGDIISCRVARRLSRLDRFKRRLGDVWGKDVAEDFAEYDQFLTICQAIDDFNVHARRIKPYHWASGRTYQQRMDGVEQDTARNFPSDQPDDGAPHKPALRDWYRRLLRVRETAAHLTGRLTPRHNFATPVLFVMLILWVACLHFYAHPVWNTNEPERHSPLLLGIFAFLWPVMGLMVLWIWWFQWDDRRLDYRALAEALRVRQAWALAGLARSVTDSYLSQLRSELVWLRRTLQHLAPPPVFWKDYFDHLSVDRKEQRLREVEERWVKSQESQHRKAKKPEHQKAGLLRRNGFRLVVAGWMLLSSPLLVAPAWRAARDLLAQSGHAANSEATSVDGSPVKSNQEVPFDPVLPPNWLLVLGSLLIIAGGLCEAVCERRGHEQLAKHYDQIHVVFRGGARQLHATLSQQPLAVARAQRIVRAQRIIEELGREALQENADWLVLRRSKPLELPLGG